MRDDDLLYFLADGLDDQDRRLTLAAVQRYRTEQRDAAQQDPHFPVACNGPQTHSRGSGTPASARKDLRWSRHQGRHHADAERGYPPVTLTDDELRTAAEQSWSG